jgi:hypothetical protein
MKNQIQDYRTNKNYIDCINRINTHVYKLQTALLANNTADILDYTALLFDDNKNLSQIILNIVTNILP